MSQSLDLTVSVSAEEWAYNQRRVKYLEALLLGIVRHTEQVQEWFSAAELAGMVLPGLPTSPEGMTRKASKEKWPKRRAQVNGRWYYAYHVSSLPARAFDALVAMILDLPAIDAVVAITPRLPETAREREAPASTNTAPPWVLPLMRIMKTETCGDLGAAWSRLPERLPPGIQLPTVDEAAEVLVTLGLVGQA